MSSYRCPTSIATFLQAPQQLQIRVVHSSQPKILWKDQLPVAS